MGGKWDYINESHVTERYVRERVEVPSDDNNGRREGAKQVVNSRAKIRKEESDGIDGEGGVVKG